MEFSQDTTPDSLVISLHGSFTFKDHHGFRNVLDALTRAGPRRRVIDLSRVEFLDSAALGMLLIAEDETTRAQGTLVLRNLSAQISRLFELAAMDTLFTIERTA